MKTRLAFVATIALALGSAYAGNSMNEDDKSAMYNPDKKWTDSEMKQNPHNFRTQNDKRMSMENIKTAQSALKNQGFNVGAIDGKMGPQTKNAIMQFQASNDLPTTGRLSQETLDGLDIEINNTDTYSE